MKRTSDLVGLGAGLMGAAGVIVAAAATHSGGGDLGRTAAEFLILHAAALMGVGAAMRTASNRRAMRLAGCAAALGLGTLLFCGDLAMRGFAGVRLFPFAAPIGGSLMILSWAALALTFALPE